PCPACRWAPEPGCDDRLRRPVEERAIDVVEVDLAGAAVDPAVAGPVALRVEEVDPARALGDPAGPVRFNRLSNRSTRLRQHRGCEAQGEYMYGKVRLSRSKQ